MECFKKVQMGCPRIQMQSHNSIIKQLFDTIICFQPHINSMAFIKRLYDLGEGLKRGETLSVADWLNKGRSYAEVKSFEAAISCFFLIVHWY